MPFSGPWGVVRPCIEFPVARRDEQSPSRLRSQPPQLPSLASGAVEKRSPSQAFAPFRGRSTSRVNVDHACLPWLAGRRPFPPSRVSSGPPASAGARPLQPVSILRCGLCFRRQGKLLAINLSLADTFQYQSIDNTCFLKYCLHININYTLFTLLRYRLVSTCSNHVDSYR